MTRKTNKREPLTFETRAAAQRFRAKYLTRGMFKVYRLGERWAICLKREHLLPGDGKLIDLDH